MLAATAVRVPSDQLPTPSHQTRASRLHFVIFALLRVCDFIVVFIDEQKTNNLLFAGSLQAKHTHKVTHRQSNIAGNITRLISMKRHTGSRSEVRRRVSLTKITREGGATQQPRCSGRLQVPSMRLSIHSVSNSKRTKARLITRTFQALRGRIIFVAKVT